MKGPSTRADCYTFLSEAVWAQSWAKPYARDYHIRLRHMLPLCESPIESYLLTAIANSDDDVLSDLKTAGQDFAVAEPSQAYQDWFLSSQVSIGPYRVDFLFSCFTNSSCSQFIVECDGEIHCSESQRAKDIERDANMLARGITTYRFSGGDIKRRTNWCLKIISAAIESACEKSEVLDALKYAV